MTTLSLTEASTYKTPNPDKKPSSLRYYQEGLHTVNEADWKLSIDAGNGKEYVLNFQYLLKLPCTTQLRRMVCVCNWIIKREWTGVLLNDLFKNIGVIHEIDKYHYLKQISIGTSDKGIYESWIDLNGALQRNAILAYAVDGTFLPVEQGYPLRFIDFGLYNYKNVKGLARLELTDNARLGHWEDLAGYPLDSTIKPKRYWSVDTRQHQFTAQTGEVTEW